MADRPNPLQHRSQLEALKAGRLARQRQRPAGGELRRPARAKRPRRRCGDFWELQAWLVLQAEEALLEEAAGDVEFDEDAIRKAFGECEMIEGELGRVLVRALERPAPVQPQRLLGAFRAPAEDQSNRLRRSTMSVAIILAIAAATQAAPVQSPLEIRFCPETKVWAYPLDSLRGAQGLLLQNVAIVNRGAVPVTLQNVSIELRSGPALIDERRFGPAQIEAAAKGASTALAQGMFKLAPFQFCDGRLIGNAPPAGGAVLQPGQALVLMQNLFAFKGKRTDLAVTATGTAGGSPASVAAALPIDTGTSKTQFRWPLAGKRTWLVGSGASLHTTHRWAVPEEFALDILAVDGNGSSHRGRGTSNSEFHAYGADVVAAADGTVVSALRGAAEDPPMLRRRGESMDDYYGRIGERQAANFSRGELGISGDFSRHRSRQRRIFRLRTSNPRQRPCERGRQSPGRSRHRQARLVGQFDRAASPLSRLRPALDAILCRHPSDLRRHPAADGRRPAADPVRRLGQGGIAGRLKRLRPPILFIRRT